MVYYQRHNWLKVLLHQIQTRAVKSETDVDRCMHHRLSYNLRIRQAHVNAI